MGQFHDDDDDDLVGWAFIVLVQAACNHVAVMAVAGVVIVVVVGIVVVERWRRLGGVLSIPWVGGPLSCLLHFHRLHDFLSDHCRSLKTFRSPHPTFHHFYTADPANLQHALKTNFHNYIKGRFVHDNHEEFLGNGIFSVDGIEWKQQRKTASYEFTSKTLKGLCELSFQGNAMRLAKYLLVEAVEKHKPVDMQDLFLRLTFDSFAKIGFGLDMCTLQKDPPLEQLEFVNAFDECNALVFTRYVDPLWKLKRWLGIMNEAQFVIHVATLNRILHNFIENRKKEMKGIKEDTKLDLLSRFLELRKENPEEFTDQKIRDIIINFLIAGRDTTALTLSWFFYALAQNPTVEAKLMDELNQIESTNNMIAMEVNKSFTFEDQIKCFSEHLTYGNLSKLQYLQACLQETLRLYPPVPLDLRVAVEDDTFPDGTRLRKGDTMNICLYAMGRMEWLWGKDAAKFKPERFMKEGVCQQESPFKLPAFLAGPRMCLGKDFAFLQMKVTAAILLRFFKFEVVPNHKVQYRMMLTLHMSTSGLQMHVMPRF